MALSLLLLVMAGLFTRTLQRLHGMDAERDMDHVAAASIDLALIDYTPEQSRAFQEVGEMGPLQYWITPEDLGAERFENTILTIEAY